MKLSTRLVLSYLALILLGMGIVTPLAWLAVENLYLNTQKANLLAQAEELAGILSGTLSAPASLAGEPAPYTQSMNVIPGIHSRLINLREAVIIDLSGQPLVPNGSLLPQLTGIESGVLTPEELLSRTEIALARAGTPAASVRRVESAGGRPVLYAAAPILSEDGLPVQVIYLATPLPDTRWAALPGAVRWHFLLVIGAAVLLASGAGLMLARRISMPLDRLSAAARLVASGDLNQSVPEDEMISELAVLGHSFNTMTANLRSSDQAKNAFIADVSHELRTPLTVIKGTIETLEDGALDDLQARGPFLEAMSCETDRLIRLVNDLLVLTRADAGMLNLQLSQLDLAVLARSRCENLGRSAGQRQVRLEVEAGEPCLVLADADRLSQVLDNLLDNAIRYSSPGSAVSVNLEQVDGWAACHVTNTGTVIPAKHLPYIFERFYRADTARERSQGGSGLGLAIVRGLVAAHGGRVAAFSSEDQGTTISFYLPSAPDR